MDAVTDLRNALDLHVLWALPLGVKTRLDLALRRGKLNTLHGYDPWV